MGEAALRLVHPSASLWRYPNYIALAARPDPNQPAQLLQYSSTLGFEPRPLASGILMHQPISYSADGLRNQNAGLKLVDRPPLLTVGDSYTEGFAVTDDETWPAHLERMLRRRVLNAGVRGYGLDQMVLRAEELSAKFDPDTIILAFIPHDILRSTLSVLEGAHKPYFVPKGDDVELRNVPVPTTPVSGPYTWPRRVLGYSFLLDFTMRRLGQQELWYGRNRSTGVDGVTVSCGLVRRLARNRGRSNVLVVLFPQYDEWTDPQAAKAYRQATSGVLNCAKAAGLPTLDTHDAFVQASASGNPDALYVEWHFNSKGNALAAKLIANALGPLGLPSGNNSDHR